MDPCEHCGEPLPPGFEASPQLHPWCYREARWNQPAPKMLMCDDTCDHPPGSLHHVTLYGQVGSSAEKTRVLLWRRS